MKLKKIDLSGVKDYLFQKGERIGLAVCGAIALLLLGIGIMKAGGSSVPYAKILQDGRTAWDRQLVPGDPLGNLPKQAELPDPWLDQRGHFETTPMIPYADLQDNKRRNPAIFAVQNGKDQMKVDYLPGGYYSYELEKNGKIWAVSGGEKVAQPQGRGDSRLAKIMKAGRLVVVNAVFPMQKQMAEYQRALHYPSMGDLMAKLEDMPQPLGLNVYRCEVKSDGKFTEWEPIFQQDPQAGKQFFVADRIKNLFQEAYIDEENPKMFGEHIFRGLVTPLPELANPLQYPNPSQYPKVELQGIKVLDEEAPNPAKQFKGGKLPKRGSGIPPFMQKRNDPAVAADAGVKWDRISLKVAVTDQPQLHDKLLGKIDFFDPSGLLQSDENVPNAPPMNRPPLRKPPIGPPVKGVKVPGTEEKIDLVDALVRFIDIDVEPGKTYVYSVQVRMANPNFGKKKDVAFEALADPKELISPFTNTPPVYVPREFHYYAVDDRPKVPHSGSDDKLAKAESPVPYGLWNTAVQVHRWLDKFPNTYVADWAIAERLLIRRGDTVGRHAVVVEKVPVWNKDRETFDIGAQDQSVKKKQRTHGLPVDFVVDNPPPLLVDFEGGWKYNFPLGKSTIKDESAVEMLILTPDNRLVARNSRNDTDLPERRARVENWLKGLDRIRALDNPIEKK